MSTLVIDVPTRRQRGVREINGRESALRQQVGMPHVRVRVLGPGPDDFARVVDSVGCREVRSG